MGLARNILNDRIKVTWEKRQKKAFELLAQILICLIDKQNKLDIS